MFLSDFLPIWSILTNWPLSALWSLLEAKKTRRIKEAASSGLQETKRKTLVLPTKISLVELQYQAWVCGYIHGGQVDIRVQLKKGLPCSSRGHLYKIRLDYPRASRSTGDFGRAGRSIYDDFCEILRNVLVMAGGREEVRDKVRYGKYKYKVTNMAGRGESWPTGDVFTGNPPVRPVVSPTLTLKNTCYVDRRSFECMIKMTWFSFAFVFFDIIMITIVIPVV